MTKMFFKSCFTHTALTLFIFHSPFFILHSQGIHDFIIGAAEVYKVNGEDMKRFYRYGALQSPNDLPTSELERMCTELHFNTITIDQGAISDEDLRTVFEHAYHAGIKRMILFDRTVYDISFSERFQFQAESFRANGHEVSAERVFDPFASDSSYTLDIDPAENIKAQNGMRANLLRLKSTANNPLLESRNQIKLRRNVLYYISARMRMNGLLKRKTDLLKVSLKGSNPAFRFDTLITSQQISTTYYEFPLLAFSLDEAGLRRQFPLTEWNQEIESNATAPVCDVSITITRVGNRQLPSNHFLDIDYFAVSNRSSYGLVVGGSYSQRLWIGRKEFLKKRCENFFRTLPGLWKFKVGEMGAGERSTITRRYLSAFLRRHIAPRSDGDSMSCFTWFHVSPWRLTKQEDIDHETSALQATIETTNFGMPALYLYPFIHFIGWWEVSGEFGIPRDEQYCTPLPDTTNEYYEYVPPEKSSGPPSVYRRKYWWTYHFNFLHPMKAFAEISHRSGQPWIFAPGVHIWRYGSGWPHYPSTYIHKEQREPTVNEIKVTTMLALCYGAKGIVYFPYASFPDREYKGNWLLPNPNDACDTTFNPGSIGLLNPDTNPRYIDSYGDLKWKSVSELNGKISQLGKTLVQLDWRKSITIGNVPESKVSFSDSPVKFISSRKIDRSVKDKIRSSSGDNEEMRGAEVESFENSLVEIGLFDRRDTSYVFIVNKRVDKGGQRLIAFAPRGNEPYEYYRIENILNGKKWSLISKDTGQTKDTSLMTNDKNVITELFEPGDGWLYRLVKIDPQNAIPEGQ